MRAHVRAGCIVAFTLLPTLAGLWRAWAVAPKRPEPAARRALLDAIPRDATALINVTAADMPASPDILFLGKRGTRALERCLADNADNGLRALCADMLGTLGDKSALPALRASLGDWEADVRAAVIRSLGKLPAAESVDPLLAIFQRQDEETGNRRLVLRSLGAIGHTKGISVLRRELNKVAPRAGPARGRFTPDGAARVVALPPPAVVRSDGRRGRARADPARLRQG